MRSDGSSVQIPQKSQVDQSFVVNQNQNKFIDSECTHELGLEVLAIKQIKSTCKRRRR